MGSIFRLHSVLALQLPYGCILPSHLSSICSLHFYCIHGPGNLLVWSKCGDRYLRTYSQHLLVHVCQILLHWLPPLIPWRSTRIWLRQPLKIIGLPVNWHPMACFLVVLLLPNQRYHVALLRLDGMVCLAINCWYRTDCLLLLNGYIKIWNLKFWLKKWNNNLISINLR